MKKKCEDSERGRVGYKKSCIFHMRDAKTPEVTSVTIKSINFPYFLFSDEKTKLKTQQRRQQIPWGLASRTQFLFPDVRRGG